MQDRPDGLFLVLEESLVEHVGGVSSLNHTFWKGGRFVDSLFLRQSPTAQLPAAGWDAAAANMQ